MLQHLIPHVPGNGLPVTGQGGECVTYYVYTKTAKVGDGWQAWGAEMAGGRGDRLTGRMARGTTTLNTHPHK